MTVQIIFYITITILIVFSCTCECLRGDNNAVCKRIISRKQSRYVPYVETYKQPVPYARGTYRIRSRTNYKTEYHTVVSIEAVCCDGYQNIGGNCEPICTEPCTNGKCVKPNLCNCDSGYILNFFGHRCDPVCTISCNFGQCTGPEICTCYEGYQLKTNKYNCEPVCSSSCDNGYCSEPDICGCNSGYKKNYANECEPICERDCVNGKCTAPDICTCNDGFQLFEDEVFTCEPKCSEPCIFGSCTAPDTCTCNPGYVMINGSNSTCAPVCNETCVFGNCIAPDTCSCNDGYALVSQSNHICEPFCEECNYGNCVEPDVCECLDGYVKSIDATLDKSMCKPHCENSCTNGICTAPNTCTCDPGFRYNLTKTNCEPICTEPCINGSCDGPETCVCLNGYMKSTTISNTCEPVCENCINGYCKKPGNCICNQGYIKDEMENKTCVAYYCNPECMNGACSDMGCLCDFGWDGKTCGESLFCFISNSFQAGYLESDSDTINKFGESKNNRNTAENSQTILDRPVCNPRCILEMNSSTATINETSINEVRYLFPIDSPCNNAAARTMPSYTYNSVIGIIIGGIISAMVVYVVYLVRIRKNEKTEINSGSRECVYREEADQDISNVTNSCYDNIEQL